MNRKTSLGPSIAQQEKAHARQVARWNGARKWNWQEYLTDEEKDILAKADAAKAEWQRLNVSRPGITNRAIQRAKADAIRAQTSESADANPKHEVTNTFPNTQGEKEKAAAKTTACEAKADD